MSCFRRTSCLLCSNAGKALATSRSETTSANTARWSFRHTPGSRQFTLFANAANNSKVSVHCTLPFQSSSRRSKKNTTQTPHQPTSAYTVIPFSCQISNLCRGFPLILSLRCESRAEQLIICGAGFSREAVTPCQGPETVRNQLQYAGPYLTQTHLADLVIGTQPLTSPLNEVRHHAPLFFDETVSFDSSAHNWFGHSPVHTVRPEVTEAIAQLVDSFGVNDDLAALVAEKAQLVAKAEKAAWNQTVRETLLQR